MQTSQEDVQLHKLFGQRITSKWNSYKKKADIKAKNLENNLFLVDIPLCLSFERASSQNVFDKLSRFSSVQGFTFQDFTQRMEADKMSYFRETEANGERNGCDFGIGFW